MPTPDELREWRALRGHFLNALWDAEHAGKDWFWDQARAAHGDAKGRFCSLHPLRSDGLARHRRTRSMR
jgi:hypothetical protein